MLCVYQDIQLGAAPQELLELVRILLQFVTFFWTPSCKYIFVWAAEMENFNHNHVYHFLKSHHKYLFSGYSFTFIITFTITLKQKMYRSLDCMMLCKIQCLFKKNEQNYINILWSIFAVSTRIYPKPIDSVKQHLPLKKGFCINYKNSCKTFVSYDFSSFKPVIASMTCFQLNMQ